MMSTKCDKN